MMQIRGGLGPLMLRISLAAVFVWFGALKIAGASPVERLVDRRLERAMELVAGSRDRA